MGNEVLEKKWKEALVGLSLAAGNPASAQEKPTQEQAMNSLHPELVPIAHLESNSGKNVDHKPHSKGVAHTAVGALGIKPVTAHDEYLKSKHLQALYPNITELNQTISQMKDNPSFYNAVAASHWNRLKKVLGSPEKAAYAWRRGRDAATKASDTTIQKDPYVQKYMELKGGMKKSEDMDKAIGDLKPGKQIGPSKAIGFKTFNYDHLLHPKHVKDGYSLSVKHYGDSYVAEMNHNGENAGTLIAKKMPSPILKDRLQIEDAFVHENHRGKGLGQAIYEGMYTHAKHEGGINHIHGGEHSSMASKVHQKLAQKHGLNYNPVPNYGPGTHWETRKEWQTAPTGEYDSKYKPYEFELKSEDKIDGGLADNREPSDFDQKELKDGIGHEKEHTTSKTIAREIAMDHLVEDPKYYTHLAKAIADIKPGKMSGTSGPNVVYDYTHVLKPEHQQAGYKMRLEHTPDNSTEVYLTHPSSNMEIGLLQSSFNPRQKWISPETADVHDEHQGKGLGQSMYEAAFAHAKHIMGATGVAGDDHSTMASRVHTKLSQKHGMNYKPVLNEDHRPGPSGSEAYDKKFSGYEYALKNDDLGKAVEGWIAKKRR